MTVISDSEVVDDVPALLADWLHVVSDAGAKALVILGPSVTTEGGTREVLATYSDGPMESLLAGAYSLAASSDFLHWEGPLVVWQNVVWGSEGNSQETNNPSSSWRDHFRSEGLVSFVRVAMELPGNRAFEIYTFTNQQIRSRAEAAAFVLATLGAWPEVRRQLVTARLKLAPHQLLALRLIVAGHSARSMAEHMGITERTANYHVITLADKFCTKGRSALPVRAAWLGLLD